MTAQHTAAARVRRDVRGWFGRIGAAVVGLTFASSAATAEARVNAASMEGVALAVAAGMESGGLDTADLEVRACASAEPCHVQAATGAALWVATATVTKDGVALSLDRDEQIAIEREGECFDCGAAELTHLTEQVAAEVAARATDRKPGAAPHTVTTLGVSVFEAVSGLSRVPELGDLAATTWVARQSGSDTPFADIELPATEAGIALGPDATADEKTRRAVWGRTGAATLAAGLGIVGGGAAMVAVDRDVRLPPCPGLTARARARCPDTWSSRDAGAALAIGGAVIGSLGLATLAGRKHLARDGARRIDARVVVSPRSVALYARF